MDKKSKKIVIIIVTVIVCLLLLSSAVGAVALLKNGKGIMQIGFAGNTSIGKMYGKFYYMNGSKSQDVTFEAGDKVKVSYTVDIKEGDINFVITDQENNVVLNEGEGTGEFVFTVNSSQKYTFEVNVIKAKGKYDISWKVER